MLLIELQRPRQKLERRLKFLQKLLYYSKTGQFEDRGGLLMFTFTEVKF
jgi:hypothetical protein